MRRLYRMALTALFAMGYPLATLAQHDHAAHDGQHSQETTQAHKADASHDKSPDHSALKQATCPVSGKPIDKAVFAEHDGRRVYFCCKGCDKKFKESPNQYLPALYKQIYPQTVQLKCPVMGETVDPEVFVEHEGQQIYFCCKGCDKKFEADPKKYMKKLPEVTTSQVHCPVMGSLIDPELSAEVDGRTVYFCCKKCEPKYKSNPSMYPAHGPQEAGLLAHGESADDDLLLCPVCAEKGEGAGIYKRADVEMVDIDGFRYAMSGRDCVEKFKQDKDKYLRILQERLVKHAAGRDKAFTCAMHPQIVSDQEGKCPICQMYLKPIKQME